MLSKCNVITHVQVDVLDTTSESIQDGFGDLTRIHTVIHGFENDKVHFHWSARLEGSGCL